MPLFAKFSFFLAHTETSKKALQKWDRLLPSVELPDVSDFEKKLVPFRCSFWRMKKEDRLRHDNPILTLDARAGVSIESYVIDLLHSWALGPLAVIVAFVLQFIIATGIFFPSASVQLDAESREQVALVHIKILDHILPKTFQ